MVKNGFINIYGVYTDDYIEGDALPCPRCGKSGIAEVVRSLEFEPPGMIIGCSECGYRVPERLTVYGYGFEETFDKALECWNNQVRFNEELVVEDKAESEAENLSDEELLESEE